MLSSLLHAPFSIPPAVSDPSISASFPFESHYVDVLGSRMHYVDEGEGEPILFLHGNPTSSYLWRNVLPHLTPHARCIAPDLIGMGRSDKPEIRYRFFDHMRHVEGFIEALGLERFTLVMHDWGSGLGFHYAARNPQQIRGLAFMEAIVRPLRWDDFPPDFKVGFRLMRMPFIGWFLVSLNNLFVERILPMAIVRTLTEAEMDHYRAPFPTVPSRRPVRQWPRDVPIDGRPEEVHAIVAEYSLWLQQTPIPKLLLHATPGGLIPAPTVEWCRANFPNLETVDLGEGLHYLQEDHPHRIGEAIATWYQDLNGIKT